MAVTQVSKITVRKGRKENLPLLSGGELGWAVDTQQLYIGNGSLEEGAPAEGNTEIVTARTLLGSDVAFTTVTLFDNTSSPTPFYSLDRVLHPAGVIFYRVQRNGAYRAGQLTFAYDGSTGVDLDDLTTGNTLGIGFSATVVDNSIVFRYTSTSTTYDALVKIKLFD